MSYPSPFAAPVSALPRSVELASILMFVSGGLDIAFGALLVALGTSIVLLIGAAMIAFGVATVLIARRVRRLSPRAWVPAIVFTAIAAILSGASIGQGGLNIAGVAMNAVALWFLSRPEAMRAFGRAA